jgi:hypothetical protein
MGKCNVKNALISKGLLKEKVTLFPESLPELCQLPLDDTFHVVYTYTRYIPR